MPPFEDWSSERLRRMLEEAVPENLHLDYKDKGSLLGKKRGDDISKDVSSFLNSVGGVLIYGVPEDKKVKGTPIQKNSDLQVIGFEKDEVSKEQIENLITGNISPRPGPDLFRISELSYGQRSVFVVQVQEGIGEVWQAKDKRYYKRFNLKAEPMEHYEIEMVRSKSQGPNLNLNFGLDNDWSQEVPNDPAHNIDNYIRIGINNDSDDIVESALIELWTYNLDIKQASIGAFRPAGSDRIVHAHPEILSPTPRHRAYRLFWNTSNASLRGIYTPIFRLTDPMPIATFPIAPPTIMFARVQAPRMWPNGYVIRISESSFGDLSMKMFESSVETI